MAKKVILSVVIVVAFLAGVFLLARLLVGGGEDTWICVNGEWVKHGAPSAPKPQGDCGENAEIIQTTPVPTAEGQTLEQRLKTLRNHLHAVGSGTEAQQLFPDLSSVYVDNGHGNPRIPEEILPFTYYYSQEADITISICNINQTVFICPGKLDRLIQNQDFKTCQVAQEYLQIKH